MKYPLEIIVAIFQFILPKNYHQLGHQLNGIFDHYLALAQDKGLK